MAQVFYYDLISPYSYLAAHRLNRVMLSPILWQPVWITPILAASGREWLRPASERQTRRDGIERRAAEYGMAPWRWPERFETDDDAEVMRTSSLAVMRVATLAHQAGVGEEFSRLAFQLIFGEGIDITLMGADVVAIAVKAGLDADEVRGAPKNPEIKDALRSATDAAVKLGLTGLPTVSVGGDLFWGDDRLEDASAAAQVANA